ncbi:MAG: hypothetical protein O7D30_10145, partial [Rickettsia endosymbiont of Ixodes persulcatus]|nr:hypothetical protein [Rickettsia endosymbiont of Ixodes persulcatus]
MIKKTAATKFEIAVPKAAPTTFKSNPKIVIALIMICFLSLMPSLMNEASAHATLEKTNPKQNGVV